MARPKKSHAAPVTPPPDAPPTEASSLAETSEALAATVAPVVEPRVEPASEPIAAPTPVVAPAPAPPEGSLLYKDKAGPPRATPESEGKANFGTVTQNAIDATRVTEE